MSCFNKSSEKFVNWARNIKNSHLKIHYPINDNQIIDQIKIAIAKNQRIRVVGSKHSLSPLVCASDERNLRLISLSKYHLPTDNCLIDHNQKIVTVNAGWTLKRLYEKLQPFNYFLETQPASTVFTVAGLISCPAHGGRLGASLISDSVISINIIVIEQNSNVVKKIVKSLADDDFEEYRSSGHLMGIITSITFRLWFEKIENIKVSISHYKDIFNPSPYLYRFFQEQIIKCFKPEPEFEHLQCFIDFHNQNLLILNWTSNKQDNSLTNKIEESIEESIEEELNNVDSIELYFSRLDKRYRQKTPILKLLGKASFATIRNEVINNSLNSNNMFWVNTVIRSYFMSYFIPILKVSLPIDDVKEIDTSNVYNKIWEILEDIKLLVENMEYNDCSFNLDLPGEFRFVTSSLNPLSPIFSSTHKIIYLAFELPCMVNNLDLSSFTSRKRKSSFYQELNSDFLHFFSIIEDKWLSMGAIPHWGKMYGFKEKSGPFNQSILTQTIPSRIKDLDLIKSKVSPLFINNFLQSLYFT